MSSIDPLQSIMTDTFVRQLAVDVYYRRGVDYVRRNLVVSLERTGDTLEAVVSGTDDYAVTLSSDGRKFKYSCECPLGDEGRFCKHCVATALAWIADQKRPSAGAKPALSSRITNEDIAAMLHAQDKEVLINWLMDWSIRDEPLRQKLTTLASLKKSPDALTAQVRAQIEKAVKVRGYVEYHQAGGYAGRVTTALEGLEILLQQGHAGPVIGLCETAMQWLAKAIERVDDSDGQGTELMGRIAEIHLRACEAAQPDPSQLGRQLFRLEVTAEYGQWGDTAERYTHLLGEDGLAAFHEAATKAWEKVPIRTVRASYTNGENHYAITSIMESLARRTGDVEQLVAIWERDLTFANQYLRIATAYRDAGNHEKALHWAERGMDNYPGYEGAPLRLFIAEAYLRAERHADALRIVWSEFREGPRLDTYRLLERFARAADDWEDWRTRALAHIRRPVTAKPSSMSSPGDVIVHRWSRSQGHSLLVEIFLYEQDIESAWKEAQHGGCRDDLWLRLAAEREKTHPEQAFPVYLRLGEQAVVAESSGRYEPAIKLLEKAAMLMHALEKSNEFETHFDALRQRFKAKRNLQKLAEERRSFLYIR
jgi:uncharacterized Zn finger protein